MQTTEINGFLIDEFNQYSLEEKTQGICPLCSHDRKPKNKKLKCASYDWERGLGTCHNCNTSFQLHTYQRKGASEKVYVRPNVRLMIGNVVSVLVTIVTHHFNYIRINVKALVKKNM